jgi:hypothetical protein
MDTAWILEINVPLMQRGNVEGSLTLRFRYTIILKVNKRATGQFEQPRCAQEVCIRDLQRGREKEDILQPTGVSAN